MPPTRSWRVLFGVAVAASCLGPSAPRPRAGADEAELSARLTAEATGFLDQLLGPGRAKILLTVQGERSEVRTQSEVITPVKERSQDPRKALPGYVSKAEQNPEAKDEIEFVQKDQEQSLRQSGFIVKSVHASVVLDDGLSEAQVNAVRRLLPELLRLDADRGDVLSVLRAPMLPAWRQALLGADALRTLLGDGARALIYLALGLLLVLALGLVAYAAAMSVVRAFVADLAARRQEGAPRPAALEVAGPAEALPELLPGGAPALAAGDVEPGPRLPALERRFDFLASRPPEDLTALLEREPPDDLALLFGYLSEANPQLAARAFSALPAALQGGVAQILVRLTSADPERLAMLENHLRSGAESGLRGADRLGKILSRLPSRQREDLLGDLTSRDAQGASQVEESLLPFERLTDLQPADLRRLITSVQYADWATALRGAPQEMADRVLEQLPEGAREMLAGALSTPQPADKVLDARSRILSQAYALDAQGQIALKRGRVSREWM